MKVLPDLPFIVTSLVFQIPLIIIVKKKIKISAMKTFESDTKSKQLRLCPRTDDSCRLCINRMCAVHKPEASSV